MLCKECDAEVELDEPQQCYFTGRGPCGDCRDPRTNQSMNCFHPVLCEDCAAATQVKVSRRQRITDMLVTKEYRERRKHELREGRGGRFA